MEHLRKLPLDLEELFLAIEDSSRAEHEYYLNTETGAVAMLPTDLADDEDEEVEQDGDMPEWTQEVDALARDVHADEGARWVHIPPIPTREAYEHMEMFAETVTDERLQDLLDVALDGQGAFRRFRDVLYRFPEEQKRWNAFKKRLLQEWALDWLRSIGVEPAPTDLRP